jgi:hypothetical protein
LRDHDRDFAIAQLSRSEDPGVSRDNPARLIGEYAISIAWQTRPVISAAIIVVPEPLNGS